MSNETTIIGGRQLHEFLRQLPAKVEKNIMRAALRAGASVIREVAKEKVPVKLGPLRRSIRVSTGSKKGTVTATVKAGNKKAYYAHMVEFGTRPHLIKVDEEDRPINQRLSRKRGRIVRVSIQTMNRHALRIGNNFVGPAVHHPGASPSPYMRPALDAASTRAVGAVAAKIRERLTEAGINVPAPENP